MKTLRLLSFAAAIAIAGCTGPKGDAGPAGQNGANGNANVIDHTFSVSSWTWTASPGYWWAQWTDNDITQSILNTGSVNVFVSYNNGTSWNNIPYSEVVSPTLTGVWTVNAALNTMQVNYTYSDQAAHSDPNTEYSTTASWFKVVWLYQYNQLFINILNMQ